MHQDQKYIDAILTNDYILLEELYKKITVRIKNLVLKNGGCETDAADLIQDPLLSIFNKANMGKFILTCPIDAFVYIICRNQWLKKLNKKKLEKVTIANAEEYNTITEDSFRMADECLMEQTRKDMLTTAIAQLGEHCKELLRLSWAGNSMEEVAKKMNISYAYARKKKSKCMAELIATVKKSSLYLHVKW